MRCFVTHLVPKCASPVQTRTPPTPGPIRSADAPASPHRSHDALQSDVRFAAQPPANYRHRNHCLTKPIQQEAEARHANVHHERADDIYPAFHSKVLLPAKCFPHQSTRFEPCNQRLDLSPTTPPPHHSRFVHNSSAPLIADAQQGVLPRRIHSIARVLQLAVLRFHPLHLPGHPETEAWPRGSCSLREHLNKLRS